jgi:hypothetical protein
MTDPTINTDSCDPVPDPVVAEDLEMGAISELGLQPGHDDAPPPAPASLRAVKSGAPTRRHHGRLPTESLGTNLGIVLDLSIGGMRLATSKRPKGIFEILISDGTMACKVKGRLAWSKRIGLFKHIIGVAFVDVTPEQGRMLTRLAMSGRSRRVLGDDP